MSEDAQQPAWTATVLTLFPEMFPGPLGLSLAGTALADGIWALETVDIRDFARDKHASVDGTPFGGGAGMVMRPDVVDAAIEAARPGDTPLIAGKGHEDYQIIGTEKRHFDDRREALRAIARVTAKGARH